ncbi:MAG: hypothetical protein E6J64_08560 [Deltaproteobacteria bacterium]|nr:MAG: hypothetical protein E6J64_08560 [Deltaproteobacteria bacterium]
MSVRNRVAWCCAAVLAACTQKPPSGGATAPAAPPQPAAPAAAQQRSDASCAAPLELSGIRVQIRPASGTLRLGVFAGLKDADDENVAHLRKLAAEVVKRGAEVMVADGDVGDNPDEQETLLGVLTETGLPLLVAPGNREVRAELDAAESELRKKGAKVWDLSHARVVDAGDALVVGLPGTMDRRLLHADGACVYVQRDLDALASFLDRLSAKEPPAVLVMAVPPRGRDRSALDVSEGQNVGDPRIVPLLAPRRAPFGIFGQVWESGGRAVDGRGTPIAAEASADQLYLNPGAADRTAWPMGDGTRVGGQAALLTVQGRRASVQFVRLPGAEKM